MAQLASLTRPVESKQFTSELTDDDHIGYDAWLLPPKSPDRAEQAIHACSVAAGPIAFIGALACVLSWIA